MHSHSGSLWSVCSLFFFSMCFCWAELYFVTWGRKLWAHIGMASFCVVWLQIADEWVDKTVKESWATDFNMELQSTPYYFNPHVVLIFVMIFNRFELEHHIISMPPTLSQQREFLWCFHASKLSKLLQTQKLAAGSTASMLTSMIQIHHILVLESIPCRIPRWSEKCYPTIHACQSFIVMEGRKEMLLVNFGLKSWTPWRIQSYLYSLLFFSFLVVLFVGLDNSSDFVTVRIVTCLVNMSHANRRWFETQGSEATKL